VTRRSLVAILCAVTAVVPAACGSDGDEAPAPAPTGSEKVAPTRLGCGVYCQNAGGYGGGEEGKILMRIETRGRVAPVDDAVPVELTCLLSGPCRGAILISSSSPDFVEVGRSDLLVEAESTATIAVPMFHDAITALQRGGGRLRAHIIADYGNPECPPGSLLPCIATRDVVIDEAAP
jgi:hypothetical protein